MAGYLHRLARLPRAARREEVERLLRESLPRLPREPQVAAAAARLGRDGLTVTRYTFDEPEIVPPGGGSAPDGAATLQFTYQLGRPGLAEGGDDEIRGSGLAIVDDLGGVRFADVDAEIVRPPEDEDGDPAD